MIKERDARKNVIYAKYKHGINITDSVDTTLISVGVTMAGVGFAVPIMLPLEITATVCGTLGVSMKLMRQKLISKAQKHYEIKTLADSKLNSIKKLISKALNDEQISEQEFKIILEELDKYNDLKEKTHSKQSGFSETEIKKLIESKSTRGYLKKEEKKKMYIVI